MERILLAMDNDASTAQHTHIYIVGLGDGVRPRVVQLAEALRQNELAVEFDVLRRSMKAQMREANKVGADYAIIIGDKELEVGQAEVKNLSTGDQNRVPLNQLPDHINSLPF